ncbi:hypothetical protein [uncultured Methanobrevibacter sp.]|uniref:hypothetical protein n=1 Tax=uncultured Methanobrevibacter sp. TaxID=253161 RepID=UPI0025E49CE7|nr:hypothetical protein [uncultured Methanobrevibacter sp.]
MAKNFEEMIKDVLEIEDIDQIQFKRIEISPDKIIYFAFHENQKMMFGKLTSGTIEPLCFILKTGDEYHYCPLNKNKFDKEIVKEFVDKYKY